MFSRISFQRRRKFETIASDYKLIVKDAAQRIDYKQKKMQILTLYFDAHKSYISACARDTFSRRRAESATYTQIHEDQRANKICGRASGKSRNGAYGETETKYHACHICAAIW